MPWAQILIDNIPGIDQWLVLWNGRPDPIQILTRDHILSIFERKIDVELYIYAGTHLNIVLMCKYSPSDNTTFVFFLSSDIADIDLWCDNEAGKTESYDAYEYLYKSLIARYNRPVKFIKICTQEMTLRYRAEMDTFPSVWQTRGITATEFDTYWLFELM